jgi:UDP-N-acetylmuramyl tripeptide synthase
MAMEEARSGDIVLLAGKGHENYQILADRTFEFDDREIARRALRERGFEGPRNELVNGGSGFGT